MREYRFLLGRRVPCTMMAFVDLLVIQHESSSKWATALLSHVRVQTEIRRMGVLGMYSTFCKVMWAPRAIHNLMSPIPMAATEEPPTPFTAHAEMGQSVRKSDFSGEIWTVTPVLT